MQPIVQDVMNGYNGTVMAYGQTGAGKTYTLSSIAPDAIGMMPRAAAAIFAEVASDTGHMYTVYMSYIQIYMELLQVWLSARFMLLALQRSGVSKHYLGSCPPLQTDERSKSFSSCLGKGLQVLPLYRKEAHLREQSSFMGVLVCRTFCSRRTMTCRSERARMGCL